MLVLEYLDWMAHLLIIVCSTETEAILVGLEEEVAYSGYCIYHYQQESHVSTVDEAKGVKPRSSHVHG